MADPVAHDRYKDLSPVVGFEDDDTGDDPRWVIPHGSTLDYCRVTITGRRPDGRLRVIGTTGEGWNHVRYIVTTSVEEKYLTKTPSWHRDFLLLYDDPHLPKQTGGQ